MQAIRNVRVYDKKEEIQMKRKLTALLLTLCMIASLLPGTLTAEAAAANRFQVRYDAFRGSVFWSKGDAAPQLNVEDYLGSEDWTGYVNQTNPVHFLLDPTQAPDQALWDSERTLELHPVETDADTAVYVRVSYDTEDGWYSAEAVLADQAQPGYTFENQVLSFTPANARGEVFLEVWWSGADYAFQSFVPEEGEIMVDYRWDGEQPILAQENAVIRQLLQPEHCRRRAAFPADTPSLDFSWSGHVERLWGDNVLHDGDWGELPEPEGNSFTLYLDQADRELYSLGFSFALDWNYRFGVNYDMNGGLVFQSVGESLPLAQPSCFLPSQGAGREGWPDDPSFEGPEGPAPIHLLFDESRAVDWNAWEDGTLRFTESWQSEDRAISVVARYHDAAHVWQERTLVEKGVPASGVSFADGLLRFTPPSGYGVDFDVFWTRQDYDFSLFRPTEEKPVMVEINWWGDNEPVLQDDVPQEDVLTAPGRMRLRLPLQTESLSFFWEEFPPLRQINVNGLGEDGGWLNGIETQDNYYTLELNQSWDNGEPRDWYHIQFEFENEGGGNTAAFYEQGYGSVFWALGQELPVADAAHYLGFGFENGFSFRPAGTPQPIHLLFDGSIGLDYEAYFQGELRFVDSPIPAEKRIVGVYADSDWCSGPIFWGGSVTENGAAQGVSYEGGILTIQPGYSGDLILHIYWTQADADFDGFQGSEACPVIVEYSWRNYGEIPVPEGIPAENALVHADGGRARLRLPLDTEAVTFTWAEEYGVREISHSVRTPEGEWWESIPVDQSEPHSFTLSLDQTEERDGSLLPVTWYQVDFDFFEDSRWQLWVDWTASEGNLFFGLDAAPPLDETHYIQQPPSFRAEDENGEPCIGEVCLTLDPTHSVSYFGEGIEFWALPEYDYDPFIFVEYPHADGSWFEAMVVEHGAAVQPGFRFEENTLRFTPENEKPVMVHVFWNQADMAYRGFESTEERPVLVELMLGARARVSLPGDIPQEDLLLWHAAEHDYVKLRLPADRESLELRWAREGIIGLLEVQGAGPEGSTLTLSPPRGCSYLLELNQSEGGQPRDYYHLSFWEFNWPDNPFRDVANTAWYREAVLFALVSGITAGSSADTFSPNRAVTRSQMLTFLWRAADSPAPESELCPFTDVPENAWYRDAVLWAAESGVSVGTGGGAFSPAAGCSRAEALTFLWRAAGSPAPEGTDCPFTDVPEDAWYRDAVLWAVERGITAGSSETSFSPAKGCTRAQAVTFLFRAILYG